ncbi:GIY-YIG nuclease family protein [Modestobacter excelsi]|uniref:GIY-YIG nuclease family protein n=1 Tax=Modestobacter excelsi TaxID=2213161 RepID=UPI001C20F44D|nr:GIY-YIG nuclease family protein [Modestobacter excelsi]
MSGKQIRLFLADGTPGGLLTAEIMNWTGSVIAAPRSDLAELLKRPEARRTGVYLLIGDDPDSPGRDLVYIGEGDDVGKRLSQHARDDSKDFWSRAVVLTSKDANLTKAHARYLEARFIAIATSAGRSRLHNGTAPEPVALPEADRSDMEYFVSQAKIVLPVLGVNTLRAWQSATKAAPRPGQSESPAPREDLPIPRSPVFQLGPTRAGAHATAQEVDGEFTVRAGSLARLCWGGTPGSYQKLRQRLESDGVLIPSANNLTMRFARDYVFASPSAAAAVVLGRNANGRLLWSAERTGQSYAVWQEAQLAAAELEINERSH